jgi:hypothetical protein
MFSENYKKSQINPILGFETDLGMHGIDNEGCNSPTKMIPDQIASSPEKMLLFNL